MHRSHFIKSHLKNLALAGIISSLMAACSGPQQDVVKTAFFPPLPDEPRIQYLTSINDSTSLREKSTFRLVLTGEERGDADITIDKPLGVAVRNGIIYLVETHQATILIIDPATKRFESIRGNGGPGKLKKPVSLAIGSDGRIYVADVVRKEILIYSADGDFIKAIGRNLNMKPVGVAVDKENIYVLDGLGSVVKVLDKTSFQLLREIGRGTTEDDTIWRPFAITRDSKGYLYVTNIGTCKVLKMDADGHVLLSFGKQGDAPGMFARPRSVAVDDDGRIWVVDAGFQNVQIFNEKGRILLNFGDPGLPKGSMNIPAGIAITRDNIEYFRKYADPAFEVEALVFVTNQSGTDMLAVYGYGHMKHGSTSNPDQGSSANKDNKK